METTIATKKITIEVEVPEGVSMGGIRGDTNGSQENTHLPIARESPEKGTHGGGTPRTSKRSQKKHL